MAFRKEIMFMVSKFKFLLRHRYKYIGLDKTYIFFSLNFKKNDLIISTSYDVRDHLITVHLHDINNHDVVHLVTDILDASIGTEEERRVLKESLDRIYEESNKSNYGMPQECYEAIVSLYAEFVEKNLIEITKWRYTS